MIGQARTLLYNETLRGGVSAIIAKQVSANNEERLAWVSTSKIRSGGNLEKNALLILEHYLDPLARFLGVPLPCFQISFQKTPLFMYHAHDQFVGDTSAGVALIVAMVSSMLQLPVSDSMVVTGAIEPPHGRIDDVKGLKEKVRAALDEGLDTILIPIGNAKRERYRSPNSTGQDHNLSPEFELARRTIAVATIDEVWEYAFPHELIYDRVLQNTKLLRAATELSNWGALPSGLIAYLARVFNKKWDILENICKRDGPDGFNKCFPVLIDFYKDNGLDPQGFHQKLREIISLPNLFERRPLFSRDHWCAMSTLYQENQHDELLQLLLLTGKEWSGFKDVQTQQLSWTDEMFRKAIIQNLALMASSDGLPVFLRALALLIQEFGDAEESSQFQNDMCFLIESKFMDASAIVQDWIAEQSASGADADWAALDSPAKRLKMQIQIFERFVSKLHDGLLVIEYLIHTDPIASSRLRRHKSILALERCLEEAAAKVDLANSKIELSDGEISASDSGYMDSRESHVESNRGFAFPDFGSIISTLEFVKNSYALKRVPHLYGVGAKNGALEERRDAELVSNLVTWYQPLLEGLSSAEAEKIKEKLKKYSEITFGDMKKAVERARYILRDEFGNFSELEKASARTTVEEYGKVMNLIHVFDKYVLEGVRSSAVEELQVSALTELANKLPDSKKAR